MPEIYLTSDLHLGHEKASFYRGFSSVEEHNETLIHNHNKIVNPTDVIWHLGDIIFAPATNMHLLDRLNGVKHLVLGNHEKENLKDYLPFFNRIVGSFVLKKLFLLTHVPVHPTQLEERYIDMFNVHGHVHRRKHPEEPDLSVKDYRYINVNCEQTGYAPIHIDELFKIVDKRNETIQNWM